MFVRDPYHRLLSAYVDKLLAPNPVYWDLWGKSAMQFRNQTTWPKCGQDVKFDEFVTLVVRGNWKSDVHVMPVYMQCPPCLLNFTVIGKMDTFKRDALEIAAMLNVSETQIAFDRMEDDVVMDAIVDSSKDALSKGWLNETLKCVSYNEVLRRIVRKLQLRGIISWRFKFPFQGNQSKSVTYDSLISLLKTARKTFLNHTELKLQKNQAFLEAYRTISYDTRKFLHNIYKLDEVFFGYESFKLPTYNSKDVFNTEAFDFSKDWDLSVLFK